jgi:hypothetical protein
LVARCSGEEVRKHVSLERRSFQNRPTHCFKADIYNNEDTCNIAASELHACLTSACVTKRECSSLLVTGRKCEVAELAKATRQMFILLLVALQASGAKQSGGALP